MYVEIQFTNWKQYQRRSEMYESANWFKLSNKLILSDFWEVFSGTDMKLFLYLVCLTSAKNHRGGTVQLRISVLARANFARTSQCRTFFERGKTLGLFEYQIFKSPPRHASVPPDEIRKTRSDQIREEEKVSSEISPEDTQPSTSVVMGEGPVRFKKWDPTPKKPVELTALQQILKDNQKYWKSGD